MQLLCIMFHKMLHFTFVTFHFQMFFCLIYPVYPLHLLLTPVYTPPFSSLFTLSHPFTSPRFSSLFTTTRLPPPPPTICQFTTTAIRPPPLWGLIVGRRRGRVLVIYIPQFMTPNPPPPTVYTSSIYPPPHLS